MSSSIEPIIVHETISLNPAEAFSAFVDGFGKWYPAEYTWSQNGLDTIAIEPREGGRCFERGPNGFELDWGRVTAFQPPKIVTFTWQISVKRVPIPNAAKAGQVTVRFDTEDNATKLTLTHHGFEHYAEQPRQYREALAAPHGWIYILDCFKTYCK